MIPTDPTGHAENGNWYRQYLRAWRIAFPDSPAHPGRFYADNKWASSTPAWDTWWFDTHGCKPPYYRIFLPPRDNAKIRHLTKGASDE